MNIRSIQRKAVILAVLTVVSGGTCFAQVGDALTKEAIRTGFTDSMKKINEDFKACIQNLNLAPETVVALENENTAVVTDPDALLCVEDKKAARTAALAQFKTLKKGLRDQNKADRQAFVDEKKAAAAEKKAAGQAHGGGK